jgi:hypothetical protein
MDDLFCQLINVDGRQDGLLTLHRKTSVRDFTCAGVRVWQKFGSGPRSWCGIAPKSHAALEYGTGFGPLRTKDHPFGGARRNNLCVFHEVPLERLLKFQS